jgi:flagellar hook-basal body complex protein FliE
MEIDRFMQLRAQIVDRNQALSRAASVLAPPATVGRSTSFADTFDGALKSVNESQTQAARLSESYERGETVDIAKVMLARQQASVGFEAALQVRNKLLSAYKDIIGMPV